MNPMTAPKVCVECKSEMEEGFTVDFSHANSLQTRWHRGKPAKGWVVEAKVKTEEMLRITTYRCTGCGLLRSYATNE